MTAFATNELHVYIWSEYLPDSVVQQFTKETGIKVNISTYDSNETLYAKVRLLKDNNLYDVLVPSTYYVDIMKQEGILHEIDKTKIANFRNLDDSLLNKAFDPENKYSIPYLWGNTALCYNAKYVKGEIDSWQAIFDPKYANKVLLTDDVREVFHMALKMLGYSGNDTDEEHIKQAYEKLKNLMPNVKMFDSFSPKLPYINEEVTIGMNHNGEAYRAWQENPDIRYIYPKEGVILWVDSMVIPKGAKNIDNAYKFINFLLRPEIAKSISEQTGYASPNKAAFALMPPEMQNNHIIYPGKEALEKGEFQLDVGAAIVIYGKYWEMLKLNSRQ